VLLDIVQAGDPVLRRTATPLDPNRLTTPFVEELLVSMRDTMRAAPGVGLAAPQVGEALQLVVVEDPGELVERISPARRVEQGRVPVPLRVLVNPTLEVLDDTEELFFEGCLSLSGLSALVPRHRAVRVRALDERGEPVVWEAEGWPARIIQHELDHLAGVLYVDRMVSRSLTTVANLARWWKARPANEVLQALSAELGPA
jgi:peptide deformylase